MGCGNQNITTPGDMERASQDKVIQKKLTKIKRKILVMSGKGGVGKSTVASYLALLLSLKGHRVGLLDVDLHGPSVPNLMNLEGGLNISEGIVKPFSYSDNLQIVSMGMLLGEDRDTAVIWRGPMKISAIRQFISDIDWGELDYLIIDSPPGTGDEPLTVVQTIPDAEALIVTTPQEVSLADVRKSINFCHQVKLKILGLVENMSGLFCPHCNELIPIFGKGGGIKMAKQLNVPILGEIPIDPEVVSTSDSGGLKGLVKKDLELNRAYDGILKKVIEG